MSEYINFRDIALQYGETLVLQQVNFTAKKHEFVSIIGKSGSGKTSIIRMLSGIQPPTDGEIFVNGEPVNRPKKGITYMFQNPVLLEWRTLLENVRLPFELKGKVTTRENQQARETLALVGLEHKAGLYPHECSGGMLSRAALARALVVSPDILLMDEPFSALDSITKEQVQIELARLSMKFHSTIIFITHDINEAVFLSDRVILLGDDPSKVINEFIIPFQRPRDVDLKFNTEFTAIVREIHKALKLSGGNTQ